MKKGKLRILAGLLCAALCWSGCNIGGKEVVITGEETSREVFNIGGVSCDLTEVKVYLANYQNIYGKSYGIDLWEQDFKKKTLKNYVKDVTLSELTRIVCMDLLAAERGIVLTEEEINRTKEAATEYFGSLSEAEITYMEVTEEDIAKMYQDYALAKKVYDHLTVSIDEEVSDDEARIMEAMQIFVKDEVKAREAEAKLEAGEDFAAVASNYNQKPVIEIAVGRGELPEEVEEVAFELDNDEISSCIPVEDGYYFIKCKNKFNEELTDANKSNIVEAREEAAFYDVYESFVAGLSSMIDEDMWASVDLITDGSITTDSFFEIVEAY